MSLNDGGPAVRVTKEPVEKPEIVRGPLTVCGELLDGPAVVGGVVSFSITRGAFRITTHACRVTEISSLGSFIGLDVGPDTVVTWDRL